MREAVAESNAARAAVRSLLNLRQGAPRLSGTEALPLIGAFWFMGRAEFTMLAMEAAGAFERRKLCPGGALLLKALRSITLGYTRRSNRMERLWSRKTIGGEREASAPISVPTAMLLRRFLSTTISDAPSPRVFPPNAADRWFESQCARGRRWRCVLSSAGGLRGWAGTIRGRSNFSMALEFAASPCARMREPAN